jgi:hypothetical protein
MMTRKHFEAIAAMLVPYTNMTETPVILAVDSLITKLADFCAQENPNFNRSKFLVACYKD